MTQKELIERAVRALGTAPTSLIGCPLLYYCPDCGGIHPGLIMGWRCTEARGTVLTVQCLATEQAVILGLLDEIELDQILFIGEGYGP